MSLIFDALRKSEHERQRQVGPGLAVVPEGQTSHRPALWVLVLGVLLLLNILVLLGLLLTDRRSAPVAVVPTAATAAAPTSAVTTGPRNEGLRSAPVALPATSSRGEVRPLMTETAAPTIAAAPRTEPVAAATNTVPQTATPAASVARATEDARLPRFADLVIRGELSVPPMHLDIHVHSAAAAERFVFINMRRYNEGDSTQEGPRIERITHDGVVMEYQGQRFFLSRD
jgi:general secretion pathway protein B